ncbi:MAG TPA: membrane protein insertion efficiency factor YidD [Peptococcaceae bacterium]|nr:membrane protein insertion efficiency factor YidD [Peptococcaceae bacterium]
MDKKGRKRSLSPGQTLIILLLKFYQKGISPFTVPRCRFYPSCSHYALEAVTKYGVWRGGWLAVKRLAKCHPWHGGGYDPVP